MQCEIWTADRLVMRTIGAWKFLASRPSPGAQPRSELLFGG